MATEEPEEIQESAQQENTQDSINNNNNNNNNESNNDSEKKIKLPLFLVMGLDDSGKTALFNRYIYGIKEKPAPTELFEERVFDNGGVQLKIREIAGRFRYRDDWEQYYDGADAIIWVVDSIDRGRITESKEELQKLLNHEKLLNLPLLIIFNKQDSRFKMQTEDMLKWLGVEKINIKDHSFNMIFTTVKTCENIPDGIAWLVQQLPFSPPESPPYEEEEDKNGHNDYDFEKPTGPLNIPITEYFDFN